GSGFFARIGFFAVGAGGIVLQNLDGFRDVSFFQQASYVGLHVTRRNAPRILGKQDTLLAAFRDSSPELAVEDFAVGFHENSRIGHFIFMSTKNVSETFNLLIHAIQHLANGADFYIAMLELLKGEADSEVFGQL